MTSEVLQAIMALRFEKHLPLSHICEQHPNLVFYPNKKPWHIEADIAMPCATENEILVADIDTLFQGGVKVIVEGANMPVQPQAISRIVDKNITFAPVIAANAGGVAVSGLEMSQNAMRYYWTHEEVDEKLKSIMQTIHDKCYAFSSHKPNEAVQYAKGANIVGFKKIADAMLAFGI